MSSHRRRVSHFSRASGPRRALLRGLVCSLVEHGRIATTVEKAKEVRRHAEKAITLGRKNDLSTRRLLLSRYPNQATVDTIMSDLSPRFKDRAGGYTRIIKIGRRPGDTAEMAFLEFVDYNFKDAEKAVGNKAEDKAAKKVEAKKKKAARLLVEAKRKSVSRIQKQSRRDSRY